MSDQALTVICSKWGTMFPVEYVNRLHRSVGRHLTVPHNFICFTDNPIGVVPDCYPIEDMWKGKDRDVLFRMQGNSGISCGYPNLYMFRKDFPYPGRVLYFDLDVIITGSLDELALMNGQFIAIWDWNTANWNGSVSLFDSGFRPSVWDDFPPTNVNALSNGQQWLLHKIPDGIPFPDKWVRSYKMHCRDALPEDCRVAVFHGQPKPHEVNDAWVKEHWR